MIAKQSETYKLRKEVQIRPSHGIYKQSVLPYSIMVWPIEHLQRNNRDVKTREQHVREVVNNKVNLHSSRKLVFHFLGQFVPNHKSISEKPPMCHNGTQIVRQKYRIPMCTSLTTTKHIPKSDHEIYTGDQGTVYG